MNSTVYVTMDLQKNTWKFAYIIEFTLECHLYENLRMNDLHKFNFMNEAHNVDSV